MGQIPSEWKEKLERAFIIKNDELIFNASEIPSWLGNSHFASPSQLLFQKIKGVRIPETEKMRLGKELESFIVKKASEQEKIKLVDTEEWQKFNKKIFTSYKGIQIGVGGKVDGIGEQISLSPDGRDIIVKRYIIEAKYMSSYSVEEIKNEIPIWYRDQINAYRYIYNTGALFAALCKNGFITKIIELNENVEDIHKMLEMLEKVAVFIIDNRIDELEKLSKKEEEKKPKRVFLSENVAKKDPELDAIMKEIANLYKENEYLLFQYNQLESKLKDLKNKLKYKIQEYGDYVYGDGEIIIRVDEANFERLKSKELKEEYPEIYNRFVDNVRYKKITIRKIDQDSGFAEDEDY